MFVSSPNSSVENLSPKGDGISGWGLWKVFKNHEGETMMNGISAPESSHSLFCHVKMQYGLCDPEEDPPQTMLAP